MSLSRVGAIRKLEARIRKNFTLHRMFETGDAYHIYFSIVGKGNTYIGHYTTSVSKITGQVGTINTIYFHNRPPTPDRKLRNTHKYRIGGKKHVF